MADATYTVDFSAHYPRVQAALAQLQAPQYMAWGKFMNWTTPGKKAVIPNGSIEPQAVKNSPIVVQRELSKEAGTKIEIPMFRRLINKPQLGDAQLSGKEESIKINFAKVYIDEIRHAALVRQGKLSQQVLKEYGIPEWARASLQGHYAEWLNFCEIPSTFYNRFNYTVLNSGTYTNDTNVTALPHPHIYCAGAGSKVSYSGGYPGTAGYTTAVAAAIAAVGMSHTLSAGFLRALNADDQIRKIPYLTTKEGVPFRILATHPYALTGLRNDTELKSLFNSAFIAQMVKDNPILTGMQLFYEGWAIFDFGNAIWPVSSTGSVTTWGPTITDLTSFANYETATLFASIVLGDNALFHATGWDMQWNGETRDYKHVEGLGYSAGLGFSLGTFWNREEGTTGQYQNTDGSAIIVSYAPKPPLA